MVSKYKCETCGEEFTGKDKHDAFLKLKNHRKSEHLEEIDEDEVKYIS